MLPYVDQYILISIYDQLVFLDDLGLHDQ